MDDSRRDIDVREPGTTRQIAEAVLLLALTVILFRGFVAEGYMISTGSMAPCLLGYHRQVVCPDCTYAFSRGTRYDVDDSILAQGNQAASDLSVRADQATVCPNCGLSNIDVLGVPRNEGDQLLVQKNFFQLRDPHRWEVVVFRHPEDPEQAYVKRVVGLPTEKIQLIDGDVSVNGSLQRKPLAVQRSMRIGVYDNDFSPADVHWQPRWQPIGAKSRWEPHGHAFVHRTGRQRSSNPEEMHWLAYRHWIRQGGEHRTSVPLEEWPADASGRSTISASMISRHLTYDRVQQTLTCTGVLEEETTAMLLAISDAPPFQEAVRRLADLSHAGPITDVYGYNHPQAAEGPVAVHDLMVEATVSNPGGTGLFQLRMTDGWRWFNALFDFDRREVQLLVDQSDQPLRTAAMPEELVEGPAVVELSLFDRQVLLAVDGQEVFPPLPYAVENKPRNLSRQPVLLGASEADFRIEHLCLYRDVYYTSKNADKNGGRFSVGPEELFVLGDNSPVSVDGRSWDSSTIPLRLLIGKPFLVHLPSQQERVQIGSGVHYIRIPDFSRVRYIH